MKTTLAILAALWIAPLAVLYAAESNNHNRRYNNERNKPMKSTLAAPLDAAEKSSQPARQDIVLADFEQGYYFGPDNVQWTVEGEAFNHPTTRNNGATGFVGKGLADSWDWNRQILAGTLSSTVFTIERNFIRFLVAGKSFSSQTGLQLFIDGKPEFFARGARDRQLRPEAFDVSSFQGRKAQLLVKDQGMWNYVAVDEIVASDTAGHGVRVHYPISQCVPVDKQMDMAGMRYLTLPIQNLGTELNFVLEIDGQRIMPNLRVPLAIDGEVDFWASYPLYGGLSGQELKGKKLRFRSLEPVVFNQHAESLLKQINLSAQPRDMDGVYQEPGRPQLSFTVKRGHNADPNGLFFYEGVYHLFYQYNPVGLYQSSHWGHATSPDLFHWTEHSIGIRWGVDWYSHSGSGVVDRNNDSGLKQGVHPPILLFFSKNGRPHGRTETSLAFSVDGGKTFREYEKNPLFLTHVGGGHDPKVVWYPPEKKWVLVIHDMKDKVWGFDFYESRNLLDWKYLSTSPGWFEVPNLIPLPLDGDRSKIKWILAEVTAAYKIGDFNGREFIPETEKKMKMFKGNFGCPQNFDNAPDGRCIIIGNRWGGQYFKDDPSLHVSGGMNIPVEVTLRTSPTGPRLYLNPVKEIETLISQRYDFQDVPLGDLAAKLAGIKPDLFDIEFEWEASGSRDFQLKVWDRELFAFTSKDMSYAVGDQKLKIEPVNGKIKVRLICDRSLVSFYVNDGYEAGNSYLPGFRPECQQTLSLQGTADHIFETFTVRALRPTRPIKVK